MGRIKVGDLVVYKRHGYALDALVIRDHLFTYDICYGAIRYGASCMKIKRVLKTRVYQNSQKMQEFSSWIGDS